LDSRPPHCRSAGTGIGDRLRAGIPSGHTSHPGQLSLLPSVWREMSTGQVRWCAADGSRGKKANSIRGQTWAWVAGKTVWSLVNTCHSERFRGWFSRKGAIQMSCLQLLLLLLVLLLRRETIWLNADGHFGSFRWLGDTDDPASDRQPMTSYSRSFVTMDLSRLVFEMPTTYFLVSGTFWPVLLAAWSR